MKLNVFIVILVLGLALCAWLVRKHSQRTPAAAPVSIEQRQDDLRPTGQWQQGITVAPLSDKPASQHLKEKLRAEEERQRPWEGRN